VTYFASTKGDFSAATSLGKGNGDLDDIIFKFPVNLVRLSALRNRGSFQNVGRIPSVEASRRDTPGIGQIRENLGGVILRGDSNTNLPGALYSNFLRACCRNSNIALPRQAVSAGSASSHMLFRSSVPRRW
jgi:hypothetical protein